MSCHKNIHYIDAHSDETALDMVCFGLLKNVLNWNCSIVMLDSFLKIFCINHGSLSPEERNRAKNITKFCFDNLSRSVIELPCSGFGVKYTLYIVYTIIHQATVENEIKDERLIKISIFEYENEQNRILTDFLCA